MFMADVPGSTSMLLPLAAARSSAISFARMVYAVMESWNDTRDELSVMMNSLLLVTFESSKQRFLLGSFP